MKKTLALCLGCMLMGGMFAGCDDNYDDDIRGYCEAKHACNSAVAVDTCIADTKKEMVVCKSEQAAALRCLANTECDKMEKDGVCDDEAKAVDKCALESGKQTIETEE